MYVPYVDDRGKNKESRSTQLAHTILGQQFSAATSKCVDDRLGGKSNDNRVSAKVIIMAIVGRPMFPEELKLAPPRWEKYSTPHTSCLR